MKISFFKHFIHLAVLPVALAFSACGGGDDGESGSGSETPQPETISVTVSPTSMEFSYDGSETKELTIKSNKYVKAVCDDIWCTLTSNPMTSTGEYSYTVKCSVRAEKEERSTVIRIMQVSTELATVSVKQAGRPDGGQSAHEATPCLWGLGWNYGNQLDAFSNGVANETCWGNPKGTQATFDGLKKAGFQSVRIPITWMGHFGEAPEYKIEEAWMSRVEEVVGYAENAGLQAIINIHHDGSDSKYWLDIKGAGKSQDKENAIADQLTALWTQIANRFKDKGDFLMFETMNEIQDGGWGYGENLTDGGRQYDALDHWNQACVNAIRATGGNNFSRWIGCPGYSTNIELTLSKLVVPSDPNPDSHIAIAVHCYDPYDFTLGCTQNSYTTTDIKNLDNQFSRLKKQYLDNGIQCYIGEFGCAQRASESFENNRLTYLEKYAQTAKKYGLSILLWDNGSDNSGKGGKEANAFMNHATGEYFSEKGKAAVEALVNGYK